MWVSNLKDYRWIISLNIMARATGNCMVSIQVRYNPLTNIVCELHVFLEYKSILSSWFWLRILECFYNESSKFPNDSEPIIILFNELASRTSSLIEEENFSNYLRYCIEVRVGWNVGKICIVARLMDIL